MPGERLLFVVDLVRFVKASGRYDTSAAEKSRYVGSSAAVSAFALIVLNLRVSSFANAGSAPRTSGNVMGL